MLSQLRPALVATLFFTALLGMAYPLAVTGVGQVVFPDQANGSLIRDAGGQVISDQRDGEELARQRMGPPTPGTTGELVASQACRLRPPPPPPPRKRR